MSFIHFPDITHHDRCLMSWSDSRHSGQRHSDGDNLTAIDRSVWRVDGSGRRCISSAACTATAHTTGAYNTATYQVCSHTRQAGPAESLTQTQKLSVIQLNLAHIARKKHKKEELKQTNASASYKFWKQKIKSWKQYRIDAELQHRWFKDVKNVCSIGRWQNQWPWAMLKAKVKLALCIKLRK